MGLNLHPSANSRYFIRNAVVNTTSVYFLSTTGKSYKILGLNSVKGGINTSNFLFTNLEP